MLCGLQGSGKTTTAGKLALTLQKRGRKPLLVAADLQRPAAIEQLKVLGGQINVPVYTEPPGSNPITVCRNALAYANRTYCHPGPGVVGVAGLRSGHRRYSVVLHTHTGCSASGR